MVQIKGSAIKETIDQIRSRAEEAALQKTLGLFNEETRKVGEGEILAFNRYTLDLFLRSLEIEIRVLADVIPNLPSRGNDWRPKTPNFEAT
jgi:hypothetical protein